MMMLRTRPPTAQEYGQVGGVDHLIAVEIRRMARVRTPGTEQQCKITGINIVVAIKISRTRLKLISTHVHYWRRAALIRCLRTVISLGIIDKARHMRM